MLVAYWAPLHFFCLTRDFFCSRGGGILIRIRPAAKERSLEQPFSGGVVIGPLWNSVHRMKAVGGGFAFCVGAQGSGSKKRIFVRNATAARAFFLVLPRISTSLQKW